MKRAKVESMKNETGEFINYVMQAFGRGLGIL